MIKTTRFLFILMLCSAVASAQTKSFFYLLEFSDKDTSEYKTAQPGAFLSAKSIQRRNKYHIPVTVSDLPVSQIHLRQLQAKNIPVFGTSKWLNAAIINVSDKHFKDSLKGFAWIKQITFLGEQKVQRSREAKDINELISALEAKVDNTTQTSRDTDLYGKSSIQVKQLNAHLLHQRGMTGNGITIAVLDAGFSKLNTNPYFTRLFTTGHVILTKDFIHPASGVYDDDEHGTSVLSCMAAYTAYKAVGTAYDASYMLIRTEDASSESLLEEAVWVMGAEFADSAGADIIQSSLGYNEFDDMSMNHRVKELNGKSTLISRGAQAACLKGIIVLNSSGNEGDKDWRSIVTPADVKEVITVGGVDKLANPALFSSVGPTSDKRIKPDVAAMAEGVFVVSGDGVLYPGNGTSYACPIMSGVVACLLQASPDKTNTEMADALRLSGSNYYDPDKYIGYGIPDALLALKILNGDTAQAFTTDHCMDWRWLADKRLHILCNIATPQKYRLLVTDSTGKEIYNDKVRIRESGMYRFSIKKSKKWERGWYSVKFVFKESENTVIINKS